MMAAVFTASATITKTIGDASKVDGIYDYASLHAASLDLYNNPLTDDCVWEICTDLDETINAGIINNTNFSLTIRPNAAEDRLVKYTTSADNDGPSGNFVIGGIPMSTQAANIPFATQPAKNVTIDGSYNGDGIRHLTFQGTSVGGRVIVVYGNVTNTSIKNCVIKHTRTSGTTYALEIRSEKNTDNHPVDVLVDNCYLEVIGVANAQTVCLNGSQSSTAAGKPENTTLRNCEIVSNLRGVFFNGAHNANFEGCTFRLASASPGYLAHGIMGNAQTGVINVKGCKFLELKTNNVSAGDFGIQGITASGGATVWNIENNIFTGLDALASGAASKAIKLCAVRCGDSCVVRHNTFVMPVLTNKPTTELMSASPISLLYLAGTKKHFAENNIFVSHETVANNSLIRGALNENCGNNVFYHDGGNAAAIAGAVIVTGEDDLATADPTSKWKEAQFNADMSLADASIGDYDLAVAKLSEVPQDINGNDRLDPTYAGAEAPGILVGTLYEIGTDQGWNPAAGIEVTKIANNVFRYELTVSGDTYFAFLTELNADWDIANQHRYACQVNDQLLADGSVMPLYKNGNAMKITEAGDYVITVDFNAMEVRVIKIKAEAIYLFDDISGDWVLGDGIELTKTGDNVFEIEYAIPEGKYIIFSTTHGADWDAVNAGRLYIESDGNYWVDGDSEAGITATVDVNKTLLFKSGGRYTFTVNLNTQKISITQLSAYVEITSAGYATYYNSKKAYVIPADMAGYVFNFGTGLTEEYAGGSTVEAGRALVLGSDVAAIQELVFTDPVAPRDLASQLHGSDAAGMTNAILPGDYVYYGLSLDAAPNDTPESVGFYYMVADGAAFENGAHKAFLALPAGTPAPERILFHNNDATNIENVEGMDQAVKFIENGQMFIKKNGVVYDMMGHAVK